MKVFSPKGEWVGWTRIYRLNVVFSGWEVAALPPITMLLLLIGYGFRHYELPFLMMVALSGGLWGCCFLPFGRAPKPFDQLPKDDQRTGDKESREPGRGTGKMSPEE
ncbi:MAG: hypothetical protein HQ592_01480 [Planctomycetes bacterium]|nr:hypothetical protein [Planctomycetota bacterium]